MIHNTTFLLENGSFECEKGNILGLKKKNSYIKVAILILKSKYGKQLLKPKKINSIVQKISIIGINRFENINTFIPFEKLYFSSGSESFIIQFALMSI